MGAYPSSYTSEYKVKYGMMEAADSRRAVTEAHVEEKMKELGKSKFGLDPIEVEVRSRAHVGLVNYLMKSKSINATEFHECFNGDLDVLRETDYMINSLISSLDSLSKRRGTHSAEEDEY